MVDVATDWDEKGWAAEEEKEVELNLTQQIGHAIRHGAQLVALWRLLRNNTWVVKNYVLAKVATVHTEQITNHGMTWVPAETNYNQPFAERRLVPYLHLSVRYVGKCRSSCSREHLIFDFCVSCADPRKSRRTTVRLLQRTEEEEAKVTQKRRPGSRRYVCVCSTQSLRLQSDK